MVLNYGEKLTEGDYADVSTDPRVVEAYLGPGHGGDPMSTGATDAARPLLEMREVNTHYGAVHALRDVNLAIFPGEMVCLLGGNASGKSTTLKTLLGMVKPTSGQVLLDGEVCERPHDGLPRGAGRDDGAGEPPAVQAALRAGEPAVGRLPAQ